MEVTSTERCKKCVKSLEICEQKVFFWGEFVWPLLVPLNFGNIFGYHGNRTSGLILLQNLSG